MAWPANFSTGDTITATRLNGIISALATWGGDVSANGNKLTALAELHGNSNTVKLFTSATERLRIDSSGNVAIGTTSLSYKFTVDTGRSVFSPSSEAYAVGVRYNNSTVGFWLGGSSGGDLVFSEWGGSERVRVTSGGVVGINKSNPDGLLYLGGSSAILSMETASANPTVLGSGVGVRQYVKGGNLVFQYNDSGTTRYLYIPLTGTGTTWTHTTSAP